jgi:ectoine hydroxylase-related dioxygenase (phytanoyl-CoA dioxygenase family)
MECRGVRLYHDQALYKEACGGITPWHADQYYWPLSNEHIITAWVPLQEPPEEMGTLAFCEKSHRFQLGSDLEISDESEMTLRQALAAFHVEESAFVFGDVSFDSGGIFHRAVANSSARPREVMTAIYMDEDIRRAQPKNKHQIADMERWCPGVQVAEIVALPINAVLYTSGGIESFTHHPYLHRFFQEI